MNRSIVFFLLLVTFSCNNRNNDVVRAQKIYDESMKIHDEIMPMMDDLYRQQQRLKSRLAILKQDSVHNADKIKEIRVRLDALIQAGDAMMNWMHNVKVPPGSVDDHTHGVEMKTAGPDEQLQQKKEIESVRDAMKSSVQDAAAIQE